MVNILTPDEETTLKTYDTFAKEWAATHHKINFWSQELDKFQKYLSKGKILEVGSGGGVDAKELIQRGFKYTGTDISAGLINEAQKLNPYAKFIHQSVYELDFPENNFDGFWSVATLLHIPKSRIDEALSRINFVTKSNGIGLISLKQGTGERILIEYFKSKKFNRLFSYYSLEEFSNILGRNNFKIIESYIKESPKNNWLVYFVKVTKK